MNILVFAPHPDDDIIGCGGSILKHRAKDRDVHVVYMTSGNAGSLKIPEAALAAIREKEALDALSLMDVKEHTFLRIPDGYVTQSDEILITLVKLIRSTKPDCIYIPHAQDAHRDHKRTYKLAAEALRRAGDEAFRECGGIPWYTKTVLCYEVWSPLQDISYIEDITPFMKLKLEALRKHRSQISITPYDEAVQGLNRYRGAMTGKGTYCECFRILRTTELF
jgi:LmbE family N-acetylglucosaminyl deacetylase